MAISDLDTGLAKEAQAMMKEVRQFVRDLVRPAGVELDGKADPAEVTAGGSPFWDVFRAFRKLDLHCLGIPEYAGGIGGIDPLVPVLIAELLGYGDAGLAVSLAESDVPFRFAALSESPKLKKLAGDYCADRDCKMLGCRAMWPGSDSTERPGSPGLTISRKGKQYVVNGEAPRVANGCVATHCLAELRSGGEGEDLCLAVIPLDLPGVSRGAHAPRWGQRSLNQAALFFKDVKIPQDFVLPGDSAALENLMRGFSARSLGLTAAVFTGLSACAFDEALKYSRDRIQGGVPIFRHRNIKRKLFEMWKNVEAARSVSRRLAGPLAGSSAAAFWPQAAAMKCLATETAADVASDAIQVLGGYGLAREYPIEKLFRDARAGMAENGANEALALQAAASF